MAGGYEQRRDGAEGIAGVIKGLQSQVDSLRSGAGIRSSILRNAQLVFQNQQGQTVGRFGTFLLSVFGVDGAEGVSSFEGSAFVDPGSGLPMFTAARQEGDITRVQAGSAGDIAALNFFRIFADDIGINGNDIDVNCAGTVSIDGDTGIDLITGGNLRIFELSTTSSAASLRLDPATAEILWVTSSSRYKTDIGDAQVAVAEVLALRGRTWADKSKIDRDEPGDLRRDVGFIAEDLDEQPSLRQFVDYNEHGEPEAIQYDRLTVALLAVIKDQDTRLTAIEERLDALEG